jgi:hypothetical protein
MQPTGKPRFLAHPVLAIGLICLPIIFCGCYPWFIRLRLQPDLPVDKYAHVAPDSAALVLPSITYLDPMPDVDRTYAIDSFAAMIRRRFPQVVMIESLPTPHGPWPHKTVLALHLRGNSRAVTACLNVIDDRTYVSELCTETERVDGSWRTTIDLAVASLNTKIAKYLQ